MMISVEIITLPWCSNPSVRSNLPRSWTSFEKWPPKNRNFLTVLVDFGVWDYKLDKIWRFWKVLAKFEPNLFFDKKKPKFGHASSPLIPMAQTLGRDRGGCKVVESEKSPWIIPGNRSLRQPKKIFLIPRKNIFSKIFFWVFHFYRLPRQKTVQGLYGRFRYPSRSNFTHFTVHAWGGQISAL